MSVVGRLHRPTRFIGVSTFPVATERQPKSLLMIQRAAGAVAAVVAVAGIAAGDVNAVGDGRRDVCGLSSRQSVGLGPATPPFGPALQLRNLSEARTRIAFRPRLPAGRPFRVYVSREPEARLRRLGLAYRSGPSRWFQVTQGRLFVPIARFEQSLRELAARDLCGARSSTFRLRDGTLALLTEATDRRLVVFRHQGLELLLLSSPEAYSAARLRALANALSRSSEAVEVRHGFGMGKLPYPHGVLYTVTIARTSGPVPRFRRSWSRFSSDASYSGGLTGNARLGTIELRRGYYFISGSSRPITATSAGSLTIGPAQDRCARPIEIAATGRVRIDVFARSGQPCSIRASR